MKRYDMVVRPGAEWMSYVLGRTTGRSFRISGHGGIAQKSHWMTRAMGYPSWGIQGGRGALCWLSAWRPAGADRRGGPASGQAG